MSKQYTSTVNIKCWKEHKCVFCNSVYAYEFNREVSGTYHTAEGAKANAQRAASIALEKEVDLRPCPSCGCYQPDMIGQKRETLHVVLFWIVLLSFVILMILHATKAIQLNIVTLTATGIGVLASLTHLRIFLLNLNRDTPKNRELAEKFIAEGKMLQLELGQVKKNVNTNPLKEDKRKYYDFLFILILSTISMSMPESWRILQDWPINTECYPPVLGIGDQSTIYMTDEIKSLGGYWRGKSKAVLRFEGNNTDLPITIPTSTNQNNWGSTISVKSSQSSSSRDVWTKITIPNDRTLEGESMLCDIEIAIEFPQAAGHRSFDVTTKNMNRTISLSIADTPNAGSIYVHLWWTFTVISMTIVLTCLFILGYFPLYFQRKGSGSSTKVFALSK